MTTPQSLALAQASLAIDRFCDLNRETAIEIRGRAFAEGKWLALGKVKTAPKDLVSSFGISAERGQVPSGGSFVLELASKKSIERSFLDANNISVDTEDCGPVFEAIQDTLRRALILPVLFDDETIIRLKNNRPCSAVVDTSAVRQGAASFLKTYCQPAIRLKIPPILTMELEDVAQQFLSLDRAAASPGGLAKGKQKVKLFATQAASQGAFRFLQKAKQEGGLVFEPVLYDSDPLRSIFKPSKDEDFKGFNFNEVYRSFADRLILETARDHLRLYGSGYDVSLVTSDQGLARLALAEGIEVAYFVARRMFEPFDCKLPGVQYSLISSAKQVVGLHELLWEMASSFGAVRLKSLDSEFRVVAHPLSSPWFPSNTKQDRLDVFTSNSDALDPVEEESAPGNIVPILPTTTTTIISNSLSKPESSTQSKKRSKTKARTTPSPKGIREAASEGQAKRGYPFSVKKLVHLLCVFSTTGSLTRLGASQAIGLEKEISSMNYLHFLRGAKLLDRDDNIYSINRSGLNLIEAMQERNFHFIYEIFCRCPSFDEFMKFALANQEMSTSWLALAPVSDGAKSSYRDLADFCTMLYTNDTREFITSRHPSKDELTSIATNCCQDLAESDGFADSVQFIEKIAEQGIHPTVLRDFLREAAADQTLRVSYQGAIPRVDPRGPQVTTLEDADGKPVAKRYRLQEGSFLHDEYPSLRLKIEGGI